MKIVLLGHGKMGKLCEEVALTRGHTIVGFVTSSAKCNAIADADILIDFSRPDCVLENIATAIKARKNIVIGTTGWYQHLPEIAPRIEASGIGCLYSPNFSTGVALFNLLTSQAAQLFSKELGYDAAAIEIHHNKKLDAPSGTAQALAESVEKERPGSSLPITSVRVGKVPGTHTIIFDSPNDTVTLTHTARNRLGFAEGAIDAAEWLVDKSGLFTFNDLIAMKMKEHLCTN